MHVAVNELDRYLAQEVSPDELQYLRSDTHALEARGLLKVTRNLGGLSSVELTPTGLQEVTELHRRRADKAQRRVACRDAVLAWVYDQHEAEGGSAANIGDFSADPRSSFWGDPFTQDEVAAATEYLDQKGLVTGQDVAQLRGLVTLLITDKGIDCVEHHGGSVSEYLRRSEQPGGGQHFTTDIYGGISGGQVAWGSNVTQTAEQGLDVQAVLTLTAALREVLPVLDLDEDDRARIEDIAGQVDTEVGRGQPDHSWLGTLMGRLRQQLIEKASDKATTALLTAGIEHVAEVAQLGGM